MNPVPEQLRRDRVRESASRCAFAFALGVIALAGCSRDRPPADEWAKEWKISVGRSVHAAAARSPEERVDCEALLIAAREARVALIPTPHATLDTAVEGWVEAAESLGFECPSAKGDDESQELRMREVRALEAQVSAGLAALQTGPPLEGKTKSN